MFTHTCWSPSCVVLEPNFTPCIVTPSSLHWTNHQCTHTLLHMKSPMMECISRYTTCQLPVVYSLSNIISMSLSLSEYTVSVWCIFFIELKYILHSIKVCEWTICTTYFFKAPLYFLGPSGQTIQDPHPGISSFFVFSYFSSG